MNDAATTCENIAADYRNKASDTKLGSVTRVRYRQGAIAAEECAEAIRAAAAGANSPAPLHKLVPLDARPDCCDHGLSVECCSNGCAHDEELSTELPGSKR